MSKEITIFFYYFEALFITFGLIGSSLGYALGGYLLSIFTDFLSLGSDEYGRFVITNKMVVF